MAAPGKDDSDQLETLLARALELAERGDQAAVDAFLAEQGEHAERLRALLARVQGAGLATAPELTPQGRVRYGFRRPWRDGTFAIELDPLAFIERLAALVPRPRKHLVTYHGILAPAASDRARVVPQPLEEITPADNAPQDATPPTPPHRLRPERFSWPQLMARVFRVDVLLCPCGGRRRVLDFITEPRIIRRILTHLGLPAEPRRHAPAGPLPQGTFAFT